MDVSGGVEVTFDRITFDAEILGGWDSIRGMRIPVSVIVGQIANAATFEEVLAGYPDLEREDIRQAFRHAAWLAQGRVNFGKSSSSCPDGTGTYSNAHRASIHLIRLPGALGASPRAPRTVRYRRWLPSDSSDCPFRVSPD